MRMTAPLSADFSSDIDPYLPALRYAWTVATGHDLDEWQVRLLRAIFEVFPEGHPQAGELRYRQVIVSMGRQNGKTEIAAAIGLYGLLREVGGYVVGIASNAEQARLVYDRASRIISSNPALKRRFAKLTETRGLHSLDGSRYEIKAAKSTSLQGLPLTVGIVDEVHITKMALWTDLVNGTGGRRNGIVVGITTAGSDDSALLKSLYENADRAIDGELLRFGAFIWEASEARIPDDDDELAALLKEANPAVAEGHSSGDLANIISDVRAMPKDEAVRYRLNRFISGDSGYMDLSLWAACATTEQFPEGRVVVSIDRSPDWGWATLAAAIKAPDGTVHTEIVASPKNPSIDQLERLSVELYRHGVSTFVVDGLGLKELGARLKARGMPVKFMNMSDVYTAASLFYSLTAHRKIKHAGDLLLTIQLPRAATKANGEAYRLIKGPSRMDIDAVVATVSSVYVAETLNESGLQLF
jgi:phage terminase large subunit-like protein